MALQMDSTLNGGIVVPNAYHRIVQINLKIDNEIADIIVFSYKDKATRDANGSSFKTKNYRVYESEFTSFLTATDVNPLNINHVSQGYEYLKTLPDFQGALDV